MGHRRDTNTRLANLEHDVTDRSDRLRHLETKVDGIRLEIEDLWEDDTINYDALSERVALTNETLSKAAEQLLRLAERLVALEQAQADTDLLVKLTASVVSTERKRAAQPCACGPKVPEKGREGREGWL